MTTTLHETMKIQVTINGSRWEGTVSVRQTLADFLRDTVGLTGTHLGCEQGVCGACTVLVNDQPVRSCLIFAAQMDGYELETIEGLSPEEGTYHPVQELFASKHGLQCGFCTPGMVLNTVGYMRAGGTPDDAAIREYFSGNICRCTGYTKIIEAVKAAVQTRPSIDPPGESTDEGRAGGDGR